MNKKKDDSNFNQIEILQVFSNEKKKKTELSYKIKHNYRITSFKLQTRRNKKRCINIYVFYIKQLK